MTDFVTTTSKILSIIQGLPKVANSLYEQAQKSDRIAAVLRELNLDPIEKSDNVEVVYAYALVDYGVSEFDPMLEVLREKEIKDNFWGAYTNNDCSSFLKKVEEFLNREDDLRDCS